jgi:CheY-like chemotaxis protein
VIDLEALLMRVRICRHLTGVLDGVPLEQFRNGGVYDLGAQLTNLFLSEGWAEPADGADLSSPPLPASALVLVVDDDTDVRRLAALVLAYNGYRVLEARHGREGIGNLVQYAPDLVVLDLDMPVMDGWQFRAEQQNLPEGDLAAIPVILMTGADDAGEHAANLKAAGLVEKPFNPEKLLAAVGSALQH